MKRPAKPPPMLETGRALAQLVERALDRRAALLADPQTTVGRLLHGAADGTPGLVIEKLGSVLIAQVYEGQLEVGEPAAREIAQEVARRVKATAVYRKLYPRDRSTVSADLERQHHDPRPWIGAPAAAELAVREHGVTLLVRPYDGYLTGLFLDHRRNRQRVGELAAGQRVLNTFAYTCGFTVAAALGGARQTVSVDLSRKFLEWGKRNLTANGVALAEHRFICSDVFEYYRRAGRQRQEFDLIVLDPPTFARQKGKRQTLVLTRDLERLVAGVLELLVPGGTVLLSVNHRDTSRQRLQEVITAAAEAQGRRCQPLDATPLPEDFRGDPEFAKSVLVRVF